MSDIKEIVDIIGDAKKILVTSHINPDPDALGSALAMYWIIKSLTKHQVDIIFEDEVPELDPNIFVGLDRIEKKDISQIVSDYDTIILVDANQLSRFSRGGLSFQPSQKVIMIDHHDSLTNIEARIYVHKPTATSTAEMVFDLFEGEVDFSNYVAKALMLGLYADSGGFTYKGVTKRTFEIAARLSELGADSNEISEIMKSYDDSVFQAIKLTIDNINFDKKHKYAYTYIPREDYDQLHLNSAAIDSVIAHIVDTLIGREGYSWGFLVKPDRPGTCKVSFRARTNSQNVRLIAESMNGGGHDQASGATIQNIDDSFEALGFVRNKIDEYFKNK